MVPYSYSRVIEDPTLGRVFAVSSQGDTIYAVNGPTAQNIAVRGFTVNALNGNILDTWEPSTVSMLKKTNFANSIHQSRKLIHILGRYT